MSASRRSFAAILTLLAVIAIAMSTTFAANAAPYHHGPTLSVSNQNPPHAGKDIVTGRGYVPNELVTLTLRSKGRTFVLTTVRADASGGFTVTITLPQGASGPATITGTGATGDKASAKLKIGGSAGVDAITTGDKASTKINVGGSAVADPIPTDPHSGDSAAGGSLASTGAAVIGLGGLAIVLLLGGGVLLLSTRRRKIRR